jgi:hypothetical protein
LQKTAPYFDCGCVLWYGVLRSVIYERAVGRLGRP